MDIQVDRTELFEKDYSHLPVTMQKVVETKINYLITILRSGNHSPLLYRTSRLFFPDNIKKKQSTLYVYKVNIKYRVILTLDDDPLFEQKILTLFRVVSHDDLVIAFKKVSSKLYELWR